METLGVSIHLFLADGTPDGLRIVEKTNWSGVGLMFDIQRLRESLLEKGVLVPIGDALRLTENHIFSSPSQAAGVLTGASVNGRTHWKDASGTTLKAHQEASTGDVGADE